MEKGWTMRRPIKCSYTKNIALILLICIATSCSAFANGNVPENDFDRYEVFQILKADGFSGVLNQKVILNKIGDVKNGETCFNLFSYRYNFTPKGGSAEHMANRLLILSNSHYLGMYSIDELPVNISGNILEFPGNKNEGNTIVFNGGTPPNKIYLDGEVRELFK